MASTGRHDIFISTAVTIVVTIAFQATAVVGDCERHLPTEQSPNTVNTSDRVLSGLPANPSDFDNIVTLAYDTEQGNPDYNCIGSLIAPSWVLTAAQCFISPGRNYVFHGGGTSLSGTVYSIAEVIPHPSWGPVTESDESRPPMHDDIQLVHLQSPVIGTQPATSLNHSLNGTSHSLLRQTDISPSPAFNFMRINNNSAFVVPPAQMQYLRFKGYGLAERPENNEEPIQEVPRSLTFADLYTTTCPSPFQDDGRHRVCTVGNSSCGPCYGDVGGPLYDVDASGTVPVLVGILSFGRNAASNTSTCTEDEPVIYTAISPYVPWILSTVGNEASEIILVSIPSDGLNDTDLAPESPGLPTVAHMSILVVICIVVGGIVTLIITALIILCVIRMLRRRQRHKECLLSEESFIFGGKVSDASDPFEGTGGKQDRTPHQFASAPVKPVHGLPGLFQRKDNTQFSIDGLSSIVGSRLYLDNAPSWLNNAWERLFHSPSRQDLGSVPSHRSSRRREDSTRLGSPKRDVLTTERSNLPILQGKARQLNTVRTTQGLEPNENNRLGMGPLPAFQPKPQVRTGRTRHDDAPANGTSKPHREDSQAQEAVMSVMAVGGQGPLDELEVAMERPQSHWPKLEERTRDDLVKLRRALKERDGEDGRRGRPTQSIGGNARKNMEKEARDQHRMHGDLRSNLRPKSGDESNRNYGGNRGTGNGHRDETRKRSEPRRTGIDKGPMSVQEQRLKHERGKSRSENRVRVRSSDIAGGIEGENIDTFQAPISRVSFDKGIIGSRYEDRNGDRGTNIGFPREMRVPRLQGEGRDVTDGNVNRGGGVANAGLRAESEVSFERIDFEGARADYKSRGRTESVDVTDALVDGGGESARPEATTRLLYDGERMATHKNYSQGRDREFSIRSEWQRDSRYVYRAGTARDPQTPETEVIGEGMGLGSGRGL